MVSRPARSLARTSTPVSTLSAVTCRNQRVNLAFWEVGHKVFKSTPETFPVKFIAGDVFDQSFLASGHSAVTETSADEPAVDITTVTSLTPLRGKISGIHASSFFHLFNEQQQAELAQRLASLLSPEPGSVIFGAHSGMPEKGLRIELLRANSDRQSAIFCHNAETWIELWEGVFGPGKVEVNATLKEVTRPDVKHITDAGRKLYFLFWSVKRL